MSVLETTRRFVDTSRSTLAAEPLPTFSHNVDALYRNPPDRPHLVAHFANNLIGQQGPLAEGLSRATSLIEVEMREAVADIARPHPNHLPLDTLARLSSSLSTVALGTRVFNEFYKGASHHTERAANHLEAAIAAHSTGGDEFSNAYADTLTELHLEKEANIPPLQLDGDAYSQVITTSIEHFGAVVDATNKTSFHPDAVFLPFAVVAASAAMPNNSRLHAAATSAASLAKIIASAKFS